jgi:hypothetical protein
VSLVRQDDLENSECGEYLTRDGRKTYESGRDAERIKERYVRVAAIIIVSIDGTKNNCVQKTHKNPVTCVISSTRKDVPRVKSLIFRAKPGSINMLQCEIGERGNEDYRSHSNKGATTV